MVVSCPYEEDQNKNLTHQHLLHCLNWSLDQCGHHFHLDQCPSSSLWNESCCSCQHASCFYCSPTHFWYISKLLCKVGGGPCSGWAKCTAFSQICSPAASTFLTSPPALVWMAVFFYSLSFGLKAKFCFLFCCSAQVSRTYGPLDLGFGNCANCRLTTFLAISRQLWLQIKQC